VQKLAAGVALNRYGCRRSIRRDRDYIRQILYRDGGS
jgi:hypothetical protein